jgi:hypothetical protein
MTEELLDALGLREQYQQGHELLAGLAKIEAEADRLLDDFHDEFRKGLWRDKRAVNAFKQGRQQHALRRKDVPEFIAAHDQKHDLTLAYWPSMRADAALPAGGDLLKLLEFFDIAVDSPGADSLKPAFWTASLLREAKLHLYALLADDRRRQAWAAWQPVLDTLRHERNNYGNRALHEALHDWRVEIYLRLLDMLYELGDLEAFEAAYDEFRRLYDFAYYKTLDLQDAFTPIYTAFVRRKDRKRLLFPWLSSMIRFSDQYFRPLDSLLQQIIIVKSLRHRARDRDLKYLQRLHAEIHAWRRRGLERMGVNPRLDTFDDKGTPSSILPTPNILGIHLPPPDELEQLKATLGQVLAALDTRHAWGRRRAAVLGFWQAFLLRQTLDLDGCREALEQLPAGSEALAVLLGSLRGELAYYAGDYEDAQLHFRRAQALAEWLLRRHQRIYKANPEISASAGQFLGRLCQWRGNAFVYLGDYGLASAAYDQVDAYLHDASPEARLTQAINKGNLAFLQHNLVDHRGYVTYDDGEKFLLKGDRPEPFLRLKWDKNRAALEQSERHYRDALQFLPGMRDENERRRWQAIVSANMSNVCWTRARLLVEAAQLPDGLPADMQTLGTPVELYRQALALQQQAHDTAMALPRPDRPLAAACLANISELSLLAGDYDAAEQAAAKCLETIGREIDTDIQGSALELLTGEGEFYPENCWRIYLTLARVYEAKRDTGKATLAYERALKTVEIMRGQIRSDEWQVTALQDKLQVYECFIHFLYHADPAGNAARIFDLTEQLKARAFLDLLEAARLNLDALVPSELREKRAHLAARFNANNLMISQQLRRAEVRPTLVDRLLDNQRKLAQGWQELQSNIESRLSARAGELNPPTMKWDQFCELLQQQLDMVVLSFTIGSDQSYLLLGDARGLEVFELPGRAMIEYKVARLLWYVTVKKEKDAFTFFDANRDVVDLLLGPASARARLLDRLKGKRILIIPDGMLYYLPFELLLAQPPVDSAGRPIDIRSYDKNPNNSIKDTVCSIQLCHDLLPFYLLQSGPISYAQSASVWHELRNRQLGKPDRLALGVYRINYAAPKPAGEVYEKLQEYAAEYVDLVETSRVAQVLDKLSDDPDTTTLRLSALGDGDTPWPADRQSTEDNFKQYLKDHSVRYLIFAGHGVYHDKHPDISGIIFNLAAPEGLAMKTGGTKAISDGFFGLRDIFDLQMPDTELTFLAACQGGLGVLSRGEGVNALTRAFMHHGSPAVVASLWTVNEDSTIDLVEAFFASLRAHPDEDKARLLRAAKQAVIENARSRKEYAHPYYWAPFVLMGKR